jgi:phosphodiesterase/alkaline phosphatase D-like protein
MRSLGLVSSALVLLSALPTGLGPAAPVPAAPPDGVLVTVGGVTGARATLWLRTPDGSPARVRIARAADGQPVLEADAEPDLDRDGTARVRLRTLAPGTRSVYEVRAGGHAVTGAFATAPARRCTGRHSDAGCSMPCPHRARLGS